VGAAGRVEWPAYPKVRLVLAFVALAGGTVGMVPATLEPKTPRAFVLLFCLVKFMMPPVVLSMKTRLPWMLLPPCFGESVLFLSSEPLPECWILTTTGFVVVVGGLKGGITGSPLMLPAVRTVP
jgi:hypothetical protein